MDNVGIIACLQCDCPSGQVDYLYLQDYWRHTCTLNTTGIDMLNNSQNSIACVALRACVTSANNLRYMNFIIQYTSAV